MLRRLLQLLWFGFAALLILMAVTFSAARLLLPLMGDQRAGLETRMELLLQRPVRIGRMDAAWRGFGPTLQLHQLRVLDETGDRELLAVDALWLHLDLFASLRQRSLVVSDASLVGLDLDLVRRPDGRIALRNMPLPVHALSVERVLDNLEELGELSLQGTRLRWEDQTGAIPDLRLEDVTLRLQALDRALWADLDVPLPAAYGSRLRASLRLAGEPARPGEVQGRFFLQLEGLHLGTWSSLLPDRRLDAWGRLDLRLWGQVEQGQARELALDVDLRDAQFASLEGDEASPFLLSRLQSRLLWSRQEDGWRVSVRDFELAGNGLDWPASDGWLQQRREADGSLRLEGGIGHLELGVLSRLLPALPLRAALAEPLRGIRPEGSLAGLRFATRLRDGAPEALRLHAEFHHLRTRPFGRLPGIQGWNGRLDGDLEQGTLQLDIADGAFEQALFRGPLPVTEGGGAVHWRRADGRLSLYSNDFRLANAEVAGQGYWRVDVADPLGGAGSMPYLDLNFAIARGQAAHTGRYLPAGMMNERAVAWLDRALVAGEITAGQVLFHGPLRGFPFDGQQGRFEVRAEVRDAVLDYQPGWQPIHDLRASLAFTGAGMEILGHEGYIGDTRLSEVHARTANLRRDGPPLRITGRAEGGLDRMQAFLRASPLGDRYHGLTDTLRPEGPATLQLDLRVPLRKAHGDFGVQGTLQLAGNRLRIEQQGLALEGVAGELSFTEASIGSRALQATLWDAPVGIELETRPDDEGGYHRIRLQGPVDLVGRLREEGGTLAERLEGSADWRAEVRVHPPRTAQPARVDLELASDLRGIDVALPEPLGKPAAEARPLRLWRTLDGTGEGPLRLQYGGQLQAVLELEPRGEASALVRGTLRLGGGEARLPRDAVLQVTGRLPRLVLAEWLALRGTGREGAAPLPPLELDLALDELEFYRRRLRDIALRLRRQGADWNLHLGGQGAQGQVRAQHGEGGLERLEVELDHLRIEGLPDAPGWQEELEDVDTDPRALPVLAVRVGELHQDGRPLGELVLQTQRRPDGLRVETLALVSEDYRLETQGEWRMTATGQSQSRFDLQLQDGNLGVLLEHLGHERIMESRRANARLAASWPGSPLAFNLERIEGNLELDIGSGQLARLDAPAGRLLNILSIHSLQRRLALDFSDVFGKGFSFDAITGNVRFLSGDAYTQDLAVQAPSAQIAITGRTGFAARDYDQRVTITPLVSSNLPIAGVLAGGPAVGAALFVAEKLFGERMNRLARYQYQVTGPWDAPQLERLQLNPEPGPDAGPP